MEIAALIISVLALIMSTACVALLLAQRLSTHKLEFINPAELEQADKKLNEKIEEIEQDDEWI